MKRNIFIFLSLFALTACEQKSLEFEKLEQFSKIDTIMDNGIPYYYRKDLYIVKNYKDNLKNERTIDSFAYKNKILDTMYAEYKILMYNHSNETNIENLKNNPKDFDRYTFVNDQMFMYVWSKGRWSGKFKFNGLEMTRGEEMIRED
ncbi:MAG: hypothetical protein REI64_00840 [Pedobacter sp.]|uniref:hypothetical protein n=1 Tax=Pedobacter sp. TaxID=1411316 RepID=UPI00280680CD|nr:hypothetical protein [Pedobacter sp.]MDQ8003309.1 hypothetical protein [Pedobacter sp.]